MRARRERTRRNQGEVFEKYESGEVLPSGPERVESMQKCARLTAVATCDKAAPTFLALIGGRLCLAKSRNRHPMTAAIQWKPPFNSLSVLSM